GALALAVPGVVLFVVLAPACAMALPGKSVGEVIADGAAVARAHIRSVVAILVGTIAIAAGAVYALQRGLPMPLPKTPTPEVYAMFRLFVRYVVAGAALIAPLPAIA